MAQTETLDIQDVLHDIVTTDSAALVNERFSKIVETIESADLQLRRFGELLVERDTLLAPFMDNPRVAVVNELGNLGQLSIARSWRSQRGIQYYTEFVTSDAAQTKIDALYRTVHDLQADFHTVYTHLQGELDEPCRISTANGELTITQPLYRRGRWHDMPQPLEPDEAGHRLFTAFVGSTLWASHLAMTRSADEREQADRHALQLLGADIRSR